MNDNHPPVMLSEIELRADGEKLTVICNKNADGDFIEMAARMIRTNPTLAFIELRDLAGSTVLAYRGEHPEGRFAL